MLRTTMQRSLVDSSFLELYNQLEMAGLAATCRTWHPCLAGRVRACTPVRLCLLLDENSQTASHLSGAGAWALEPAGWPLGCPWQPRITASVMKGFQRVVHVSQNATLRSIGKCFALRSTDIRGWIWPSHGSSLVHVLSLKAHRVEGSCSTDKTLFLSSHSARWRRKLQVRDIVDWTTVVDTVEIKQRWPRTRSKRLWLTALHLRTGQTGTNTFAVLWMLRSTLFHL